MAKNELEVEHTAMESIEMADQWQGVTKRSSPNPIEKNHKKMKVDDEAHANGADDAKKSIATAMITVDGESESDLLNWTLKYMGMAEMDNADTLDKYVISMLDATFKDYSERERSDKLTLGLSQQQMSNGKNGIVTSKRTIDGETTPTKKRKI